MKFIEKTHKYTDGTCEYLPVTYLTKRYQEKVDWDEIASKKAIKEGITKEELLAKWEEKRNKAAEKGTRFHQMMEQKYKTSESVDLEGCACIIQYFDTVDGTKEDHSCQLENNTVYTEKMIWSNRYKVCGTADLVEVVNGKIHIKDYKTNEKLDMEAFRHPNPRIGKRMLLAPFNNLDDCNFNIYQIQLNVYMWMLLKSNPELKIGEMTILHIPFDEDDNPMDPIPYRVSNLQRQVDTMFKNLK